MGEGIFAFCVFKDWDFPNGNNIFFIFVGILGCFSFAYGQFVFGAFCVFFFWEVLDTTDGTMARTLGIKSNYGGFVDYIGGMFVMAFISFSVGIGLYQSKEIPFKFFLDNIGITIISNPSNYITMGAFCSISAILIRLIIKIAESRFGHNAQNVINIEMNNISIKYLIIKFVKNTERLGGYHLVVLFLSIALNTIEFYLIFFTFYIVFLLAFTINYFYRLRQSHEYLQ